VPLEFKNDPGDHPDGELDQEDSAEETFIRVSADISLTRNDACRTGSKNRLLESHRNEDKSDTIPLLRVAVAKGLAHQQVFFSCRSAGPCCRLLAKPYRQTCGAA
jgi:hypothetical protein